MSAPTFDGSKKSTGNSFDYPRSIQDNPNKVWLEQIFRKHYFCSSVDIELDDYVSEREFGFRLFDGHVRRHLNFKNKRELIANLIKFSPSDVFCSSARYQFPSADMNQKGWIGSDLIFDIDGKDLQLECALGHNLTSCKNCTLIKKGVSSNCIGCDSPLVQLIELPCKDCIRNLKGEVNKLIQVLHDDFGIEENNIHLFFSGNNGFHIHIIDNAFFKFNSMKRSALVQYLLGKGYLIENLGFQINRSNDVKVLQNKILYNKGWRARLLDQLHLQLKNHRIDDKFMKKIIHIKETNKLDISNIINNQIILLSVKIDPNVTVDVHRIFRLAGTINSKSGLIKTRCKDLKSFDPFKESCIHDESPARINAFVDTRISLKDTTYKIKTGVNYLPAYVVAYVISKGLGDIYIEN